MLAILVACLALQGVELTSRCSTGLSTAGCSLCWLPTVCLVGTAPFTATLLHLTGVSWSRSAEQHCAVPRREEVTNCTGMAASLPPGWVHPVLYRASSARSSPRLLLARDFGRVPLPFQPTDRWYRSRQVQQRGIWSGAVPVQCASVTQSLWATLPSSLLSSLRS